MSGFSRSLPVRLLCSKERTRRGSDLSLRAAWVIPFSLPLGFTTNQTSTAKKEHGGVASRSPESHTSMPLKVGRLPHRRGNGGELLGSQRWQRQWLVGRGIAWPFLTKEVEGEGGRGRSAPCMFYSWKNPLLSLRKDCSEWGEASKAKRTSENCLLLSAPGFWSMHCWEPPLSPSLAPTWGSPLPGWGHIKVPRTKYTPPPALLHPLFLFPWHPLPTSVKSAPTLLRETKNLCYSAIFEK